jgi:hypothetical protein
MSNGQDSAAGGAAPSREAQLKAIRVTQVAGIFNMMTAVAFMVAAMLRSRQGESGAVWIALGAAFIAIGGSALGRAKRMSDKLKETPAP